MKILFLSRWYPYPADNGSRLRIFNLLQILAEHHELTLLSFDDRIDTTQHAPELQSLCHRIEVVPWKPFNQNSWRARIGYFSSKPRMVVDTFSSEMTRCIEQTLSATAYDLIIASQVDMAMYSAHFQGVPAIFEELELGTYYDQFISSRGWRRFRNGLTWHKHKRWLAAQLRDFKVCTVVSDNECKLALQAIPNYRSFEVIPNFVRLDDYSDTWERPKENTLIFTGSFSYYPNYEGMCWFLREVYPLIQTQIPDIRLTITGKHSNYPLPNTDNVTLTGYVDDIRPYVASSWASLVPLHQGGGTRLKILEAMALKTPVIATSKGAEGLDVHSGEHVLIADTPQAFAQAVIRLAQDPQLRFQLAENAYRLLIETYDWRAVMPRFLSLMDRTVGHVVTATTLMDI